MLLSLSKNFLFVHVNRAAGTSIKMALEPYATAASSGPRDRWLRRRTMYYIERDPAKMQFGPHVTARQIRSRLPAGLYDQLLTAAFVRNPYSWLVSIYNVMQKSKGHRHRKKVISLGGFPAYVDWEMQRNKRSVHRFVTDASESVMVDFVGRFERLQDDYDRLCDKIGIESKVLPVAKTARPHSDYRSYYDDATIEKVSRHWATDLRLFGYAFDGPID